jgi:hypothetical protein
MFTVQQGIYKEKEEFAATNIAFNLVQLERVLVKSEKSAMRADKDKVE